MKTKIVILFIAFLPFTISCQNFSESILTGKTEKLSLFEMVYKYQPVGTWDNCFTYLLLPDEEDLALGNNYRIEKYDSNMNLLIREKINLKDKNGEKKFSNVIYFQHKLYLFSSFKNHNDKKIYLFAQTIDKNTLSLNNDIRMIAEFENTNNKRNVVLRTNFSISPDSSKLLLSASSDVVQHVQISKIPFGKELENSKVFVCVFDKDVNLVWQQEAANAINSGTFVFDKFIIDNAANVYLTGKSFENSKQAGSVYWYNNHKYYNYIQPSNFKNCVLYFGNNGKDLKQLNIETQGVFAKSVVIKPKGDYIFCAGIYSSPGMISAKGIFSCRINLESGKTDNLTTKPFPENYLVPQVYDEDLKLFRKETNIEETDPFEYSLSELEQTLDGDFLFISEQQQRGKLELRDYNSFRVFSTLNYNNLYVTTLSNTGEIKNVNVIDKKQFAFDDFIISYSHLLVGNDVYLLFNNIPKNKNNGLFSSTSSTLQNTTLVKLDKNNKQTTETINDLTKMDNSTLYGRFYGTIKLPKENAIIYPIQANGFRIKSYQKVVFKP